MADHFLTKSRIDLQQWLELGEGYALDQYDTLRRLLQDRASPEAAALFAEPLISRGNDTAGASVSWYTDTPGEGRPLASLDDAERARAEAILGERLRAVRALLADPETGPLVDAALHLAGPAEDNVWVVDGAPVIINWAMLPEGTGRDAAARAAHFGTTLGRYLPLGAAPPLAAAETGPLSTDRMSAAGASPRPQDEAAVGQPDPATAPAEPAAPASARPGMLAWLPLLVLLLVSGAVLVWLLLPGTRIFPVTDVDPAVDDAETARAIMEINASLEDRLARLQVALDQAQCQPDGTLLMPDGRMIEGLLAPRQGNPADAPGQRAAADPQAILPSDPARVDPSGGGASAMAVDSLLDLIEARTVLVVAATGGGAQGAASGVPASGFFVAPDLVVTNHHVVRNADQGKIFVTNRAMGTLHPATVIKAVGPLAETGQDFALLRVPGVSAEFFTVLRTDESLKLQSVIAAGYPGDVLTGDVAFRALWNGNSGAVPDLTVTDGTVNAEQALAGGAPAVVHSAPISQGNSGGPLIDMCGRVIGVNTFVRQGVLRNLNFALGADALLAFLETAGLAATLDIATQPCQPQVLRPAPPAPAALPVQPPVSGN